MKLTIGMPCYNDYSGAWFTMQALRLQKYFEDIEFLLVDTSGDDNLKKFVSEWGKDNCKYIRYLEPQGTAPAKNAVFENAHGDFVLCIDSHVLFMPDSIEKLISFIQSNPGFAGLGYGVLVYDNLIDCNTEMEAVWRGHMWGIWGDNKKIDTIPTEPFEIWGHGGGCFFSKRDAWLGFHDDFRGFGGEEGYLAEKYRKNNKKVMCFPFLKWVHRFDHGKAGTGFSLKVEDRIRNYLIGFRELELDTKPIYEHFGQAETEKIMQGLQDVVIKSFNGIGDLLYATPSFSAIKESNPNTKIIVNTNYPEMLEGNPHVEIGKAKDGVFLGYPDVIHGKQPTKHHIFSDWEIICEKYGFKTNPPVLKPEIYFDLPKREGGVIVQVDHKNSWHGKKAWPHAEKFADTYGFTAIPHFDDIRDLVRFIAKAQMVVCMEGGIHHIAAAVGTPAIVVLGGIHRCAWVGYDSQRYIETDCDLRDQCYNPDPCNHANKIHCMNISAERVYQEFRDFIKTPVRLYPSKKKLNLGSGEMLLLEEWVNFDAQSFKRHGIATDSFGLVENITEIYKPETFDEILSAHVIEHMLEPDSIKMLENIHSILKPNGKAVIEGPDFIGAQKVAGEDTQKAIRWVMSHTVHPKKWGDHWYHKSAWTKQIVAAEMEKIGFEIKHIGIGTTHGMGERDFRVEGIKHA